MQLVALARFAMGLRHQWTTLRKILLYPAAISFSYDEEEDVADRCQEELVRGVACVVFAYRHWLSTSPSRPIHAAFIVGIHVQAHICNHILSYAYRMFFLAHPQEARRVLFSPIPVVITLGPTVCL
jgi:hypothetical protein